MKEKFESWIPVPETDGRFWISSFGHFRKMARKKRFLNRMINEFCNEDRPLVADYRSGVLGWYAYYDGVNHFMPRDELMNLFPPEWREVDTSKDEEAEKLMSDTFRDLGKERGKKSTAHEGTTPGT